MAWPEVGWEKSEWGGLMIPKGCNQYLEEQELALRSFAYLVSLLGVSSYAHTLATSRGGESITHTHACNRAGACNCVVALSGVSLINVERQGGIGNGCSRGGCRVICRKHEL